MNLDFLQNLFNKSNPVPVEPVLSQEEVKKQAINDALQNILDYQDKIKTNPSDLGYSEKSIDLINRIGADKVANDMVQGLNNGIPEIADYQSQYNNGTGRSYPITIPKTPEQLTLAQKGQLNTIPALDLGVTDVQNPQKEARKTALDNLFKGLNEMQSGFKENLTTPFAVNNLKPNENKSTMNKVGEALGTATRFLNSPTGRALIVAGVVKGTGGSGLQALGYGSQTATGAIENQSQDNLYRAQLKKMGYSDEEINKMPGYIKMGDFKAIADGMYKQNYTNYRDKKLDQDSYQRAKKQYDDLLLKGSLSPAEYKEAMSDLNARFINSNIKTNDGGDVQVSNDTRKTDSTIDLNDKRGKYLDVLSDETPKRTGIMQQNANANSSRANTYDKNGGRSGGSKPEDNPNYGTDLAEYNAIMQSGDKGKINYARNQFIKRHNIDPDKKLKSSNDILDLLNE